jgi:hypothetical protein
MAKTNIRDIVTKPVSVEEPKIVEIPGFLAGKSFLPGSPAGSEAKPAPKRDGFRYS